MSSDDGGDNGLYGGVVYHRGIAFNMAALLEVAEGIDFPTQHGTTYVLGCRMQVVRGNALGFLPMPVLQALAKRLQDGDRQLHPREAALIRSAAIQYYVCARRGMLQ